MPPGLPSQSGTIVLRLDAYTNTLDQILASFQHLDTP
jgi:hypothetical protein